MVIVQLAENKSAKSEDGVQGVGGAQLPNDRPEPASSAVMTRGCSTRNVDCLFSRFRNGACCDLFGADSI